MAKRRKRKLSKDAQKAIASKRSSRRFTHFLFLGALIAIGYVLYDPFIIENQQAQDKILGVRSNLLTLNSQGQEKLLTFMSNDDRLQNFTKHLPQGEVLGQEEIEVEAILGEISQRIQNLPASKVKKIKKDFCSDVIDEALAQ